MANEKTKLLLINPTSNPSIQVANTANDELSYKIAAIFVDNAMHKRRTESSSLRSSAQEDYHFRVLATRAFFLGHNRWWRRFVFLAIFVQLLLALWEKPSSRAPNESAKLLILLAGIELLCIFVYIVDMGAKLLVIGAKNYLTQGWSAIKVVVVTVMLVDILVILISPNSVRFSRPLRAFMLLEKGRTVRHIFMSILRTIPKTAPVFIMQLFLILIYAQFGTVIFREFVGPDYTEFSNLIEAMVSMFVLTTTENYPDVMIPAYAKSQFSSIFFISFLFISQLFLMNLVLAVFYETYSSHILDNVREGLEYRKESLIKAFDIIKNSEDLVDFTVFEKTMKHMKKHYSPEKIQFIFHVLDKDHNEELTQTEFLLLCDILQWEFYEEEDDGLQPFGRSTLLLYLQSRMKALTRTRLYNSTRTALIVLVAFYNTLEVALCSGSCAQWEIADITFTVLFMVEVLFRLVAIGPKEFFKDNWNKFDSILITICFVFDVIVFQIIADPFKVVFLLKTLLIVRVIASMKQLTLLVSTALHLFPSLICFASILLALFYFYAIIGMEIFWGRITSTNPYLAPTEYYYVNFNSLTQTLVTLYGLMTVNNWNTFMDGAVAATNKWSRLYFMTFYIVAVVIVLSVIIAFIIEAFVEQHKLKQASDGTLQSDVWDDEVRERTDIARNRVKTLQNSSMTWRVRPKRNLETMYETLFKTNEL